MKSRRFDIALVAGTSFPFCSHHFFHWYGKYAISGFSAINVAKESKAEWQQKTKLELGVLIFKTFKQWTWLLFYQMCFLSKVQNEYLRVFTL